MKEFTQLSSIKIWNINSCENIPASSSSVSNQFGVYPPKSGNNSSLGSWWLNDLLYLSNKTGGRRRITSVPLWQIQYYDSSSGHALAQIQDTIHHPLTDWYWSTSTRQTEPTTRTSRRAVLKPSNFVSKPVNQMLVWKTITRPQSSHVFWESFIDLKRQF